MPNALAVTNNPARRKRHRDAPDKIEVIERQRHWLGEVCRVTGDKPSRVALTAGVSDTTLTRLRKGLARNALSQLTIDRIKRAFNVPGPEELAGQPGMAIGEATAVDIPRRREVPGPTWRINSPALLLAGYLPGDIVVIDPELTPREHDIVCVEVMEHFEIPSTIFRIYEPPFLIACAIEAFKFPPLLLNHRGMRIVGVVIHQYRDRSNRP